MQPQYLSFPVVGHELPVPGYPTRAPREFPSAARPRFLARLGAVARCRAASSVRAPCSAIGSRATRRPTTDRSVARSVLHSRLFLRAPSPDRAVGVAPSALCRWRRAVGVAPSASRRRRRRRAVGVAPSASSSPSVVAAAARVRARRRVCAATIVVVGAAVALAPGARVARLVVAPVAPEHRVGRDVARRHRSRRDARLHLCRRRHPRRRRRSRRPGSRRRCRRRRCRRPSHHSRSRRRRRCCYRPPRPPPRSRRCVSAARGARVAWPVDAHRRAGSPLTAADAARPRRARRRPARFVAVVLVAFPIATAAPPRRREPERAVGVVPSACSRLRRCHAVVVAVSVVAVAARAARDPSGAVVAVVGVDAACAACARAVVVAAASARRGHHLALDASPRLCLACVPRGRSRRASSECNVVVGSLRDPECAMCHGFTMLGLFLAVRGSCSCAPVLRCAAEQPVVLAWAAPASCARMRRFPPAAFRPAASRRMPPGGCGFLTNPGRTHNKPKYGSSITPSDGTECVLQWRHFSIYDITITHIPATKKISKMKFDVSVALRTF